MNTTISISAARKIIFDIAENVQAPHQYYTLTENGSPKVVILSADEYESLIETLEIARLFPDLTKRIKSADTAVKTRKPKNHVSLSDLKQSYVPTPSRQKRKKIAR